MSLIPNSNSEAQRVFWGLFHSQIFTLNRTDFVRLWWAFFYLNPGLHPDGFDVGSGWPAEFRPVAREAWRRFELGELTDEELYPADAAWAALYDGMEKHTDEESDRRKELRAFQATAQDS